MIKLTNVNFFLNKKRVLKDINIQIKNGETVAFIGESGCGKTTLTRVINALAYTFYDGEISGDVLVNSTTILDKKLYEVGKIVGSIFQNPKSQFFTQIVEDEIAFGLENYGVKEDVIDTLIDKALNEIHAKNLQKQNLFHLSNGQRQKVAIASINALDPNIYLFDEPSANLDMQSIHALKQLMQKIKDNKKTLIISEHRLYYLADIVDRYFYMENGEITHIFSKRALVSKTLQELNALKLRSLKLSNLKPKNHTQTSSQNTLKIEKLSFSFGKKRLFEDLNFTFYSGKIYALIGKNGAGKSSLGKILAGVLKQKNGRMYINNAIVKKPIKKIYYLSNEFDTNLFCPSVSSELRLANQKAHVDEILKNFNLTQFKNTHPLALSSGQKQRLTIGVALTLQ